MAEVLMVCGKPETIFEARDFEYLIDKHLGYDAGRYFRELIEGLEEQADETEAKVNTDLGAYEASLESNTLTFQDILEELEIMNDLLNKQRVDKSKLFKIIEQIRTQINNQI